MIGFNTQQVQTDKSSLCNEINRSSARFPTVARFAICGSVRPRLTEALWIGEMLRSKVMGCSQRICQNATPVFSGKRENGERLDGGHRHAHFLPEANNGEGRITHLTVYAPMGFSPDDERALERLQFISRYGRYELQMVLLGIGQPEDFGGLNEKAGQAPLLAESRVWVSRTPFILTRHLKFKSSRYEDPVARQQAWTNELSEVVRKELHRRESLAPMADRTRITPLLGPKEAGTALGGHFTTWLKFRRERKNGKGRRAGSHGYGFRLEFPKPIRGPIALGYGCHFGLGQFVPQSAKL